MRKFRYRSATIVWMSIILVMLLMTACQQPKPSADNNSLGNHSSQENGYKAPSAPESDENLPPPSPEPYYKEARLTAVGDIMMHLPQTKAGYDVNTQTYQFDSFFTEVASLLSAGDWVIGNLETPLSDNDPRGYTGFPEFNAPPELADALKTAGFNILTTANNHALDRRERGIISTLEHVKSRHIVPIGTAATQEEAEQLHIITHNEISMAILAYTYGTNGIPIPEGKSYLVSLIDEQKMIDDIKKARDSEVDLVTIALHFGNEYQPLPTKEQQSLVEALFRAGADIILGSHPHVLQPYEVKEIIRNDGTLAQGIVIYSMGNFISNQDRIRNNKKPTDVGVIFEINIRKHFPEGRIEYKEITALPTYVHKWMINGKQAYRVLPLESVLTERTDSLLKEQDFLRLDGYYQEAVRHLAAMTVPVQATLP